MKLKADEQRVVAEAFQSLRVAPGYKVVEAHLESLLEDYKNALVTNQNPLAIPVYQGRAQQLGDILTLMKGKI